MKHNSLIHSFAALLVLAGNAVAVETHSHPHPGPVKMHGHAVSQDFLNKLDVGFLMELETFAAKSGDVSESDIALATVELTADANVTDSVALHLGLLWEEDGSEENILDEGHVTWGATDAIPFYATAGRMYLPFGNFESAFISDPLTLELAEINQSAVLVGYGNSWVDLNAGVFNGDFESGDNSVDDAFASVAFTPFESVVFGIYWLSDILDADGFEGFVDSATNYAYEASGGAGVFLNAWIGPVSLNAEYVAAIEELDLPGGGQTPSAYNVEASMPVVEKVTVGVKFEGSDDFYSELGAGKWADWQTGFVVSYGLSHHITLSGEVLHADGLDDGESGDRATMQMALVF